MVARSALAALAILPAVAAAALGQEGPALTVALRDATPPEIVVRFEGLFTRIEFLDALRSGFPLYVAHHAALRESQTFKDRTVDEFVWEYVVLFDPVRDRFALETGDGATEVLPDRIALERRLAAAYVVGLEPDGSGSFYYETTVEARTLSDEDVDEAFAWLRGANSDSVKLRDPGFFGRLARRVLVRLTTLPHVRLKARTAEFGVP